MKIPREVTRALRAAGLHGLRGLCGQAAAAATHAYAPFSGYLVGAAILTADGVVYLGANAESGPTTALHAEIAALAKMRYDDPDARAVAIAVSTVTGKYPPCGECRQPLYQANPDMLAVGCDREGVPKVVKGLGVLLPNAHYWRRAAPRSPQFR